MIWYSFRDIDLFENTASSVVFNITAMELMEGRLE